jgi:hypothetical protein
LSEHARKRARAVLRGRDDGNIILLPDRSWVGWFRHVTLVLLVLAVLTVLCAQEQANPLVSVQEMSRQVTPSPIPLTVPEVRRLLGRLLFPLPRSAMAVLAWSWWRRGPQSRARASHAQQRLNSS